MAEFFDEIFVFKCSTNISANFNTSGQFEMFYIWQQNASIFITSYQASHDANKYVAMKMSPQLLWSVNLPNTHITMLDFGEIFYKMLYDFRHMWYT